MQKPSLGWQSWSPPFPKWHGFPRWDYAPINARSYKLPRLNPSTPIPAIRYWCSWYAYGWNIDHKKISETLKIIKKHRLPFTHIIIDDGWTTWGDWLTPNPARFPHFATTISQIRAHHLQVGLWFAPFLASKKSQLFKQHPDWFVRYRGQYIQGLKTMPIWEWFLPQQYLLDFKLPQVKKYIKDFIDYAVKNWGVTLLKLDFLYAPYFDPHHNNDKIAHNQITWLFRYIKKNYPSVQTIACGAPFAPTIGLANIIRISKDTALPPELPYFLNRIIYAVRVKMLAHKLGALDKTQSVHFDPDVRKFSLDNHKTSPIWDTIPSNIQGVGDDLINLSLTTLKHLKQWLAARPIARTKQPIV